MKNLIFIIFGFCALGGSDVWADEKISLGDSYGKGDQFHYDMDTWRGEEQVISRLIKEDEIVEFVRVSKGEFEVRREKPERVVYFRYSRSLDAMSPGLDYSHLVDFVRVGDQVSVLMRGVRGYFYMRASSSAPKVEPPKHFLPNKKLVRGEWIPRYIVAARDFYGGKGGVGAEEISLARLKSINEIEFVLKKDAERASKVDVFTIQQNSISKNGVECVFPGVAKGRELGVVEESEFTANFLNKETTLENLKNSFVKAGYAKGDILDLISRFQDRESAGKIEEKLNRVFANDENR